MKTQINYSSLSGTIQIPSSKSDGQRAVLAAALSEGKSTIYNLGSSNDELAMVNNVREIGAKVEVDDLGITHIKGFQTFPMSLTLNIGESGLGLRLMTAICAVHEGRHFITGDGSILKRSQGFFEDYLPKYGACVNSNDGYLPIQINDRIKPGVIKVDGSLSSQYISGLLMALPLLESDSELHVENLNSTPYVDMTIDTLSAFGIEIKHQKHQVFEIKGNQNYIPTDYTVEGDWSSASCWLVASALGSDIEILGLNLKSKQADNAILDAFQKANCSVEITDGKLSVDGTHRTAFSFDATHCPDLFPALVTFAAFCEGVSYITGVFRLKNKESDRGEVLKDEFGKIGVTIELKDDVMHIHGGGELKPSNVDSHNDHRIAMCLGIAGTYIQGGIEIENSEAVAKSYPNFWEDLSLLTQ